MPGGISFVAVSQTSAALGRCPVPSVRRTWLPSWLRMFLALCRMSQRCTSLSMSAGVLGRGRCEPGRSGDSSRPDCSFIGVTVSRSRRVPPHGMDSARDFRPFSAVSMIVFSARRLSIPIIGTLVPTASS